MTNEEYDKAMYLPDGSRRSRIEVRWIMTSMSEVRGEVTINSWHNNQSITDVPEKSKPFSACVKSSGSGRTISFRGIEGGCVAAMTKEEHNLLSNIVKAYADCAFGTNESLVWVRE